MIRISQIFGAILMMIGIIFLIDNSNSPTTTILGTTFRNGSINIAPALKGFLGILFIVIGIFMASTQLQKLFENK